MELDPAEEGCAVVAISAEESSRQRAVAVAKSGGQPYVVFLNRHGGTYRSGSNDSSRNRSSIISGTRTLPAYNRGDARWNVLVDCVREQFSRFNVFVTDVEPVGGNYVETVIGGRPSDIGRSGIGGIAPVDFNSCSPIEKAVAYVFPSHVSSDRRLCEVTAHEIGHTISLEHEYKCEDPMTYLGGCQKTFQDSSEWCGTRSRVRCRCRGGRQNTVQALYDLVGSASDEPPLDPADDHEPPVVVVMEPEDQGTREEHTTIRVVAQATDDVQISRVELHWDYNDKVYPCPTSERYVTCRRQEDGTATWQIEISTGQRTFRVRVLDFTGKEAVSETRTIYLTETGEPPPESNDHDPPEISNVTPEDGARALPGTDVIVEATITDEVAIAETVLEWDFNGSRYPCPGEQRYVSCTVDDDRYRWTVRVGAEDERPFRITTVDTAGNRATTDTRVVHVAQVVDEVSPTVELLEPTMDSTWRAHSEIRVVALVSDDIGIASVALVWEYNNREYGCPIQGRYVDCEISGDIYTWTLTIGSGTERSFLVRASDGAGNISQTEELDFGLEP
jgi:hypothetical protein